MTPGIKGDSRTITRLLPTHSSWTAASRAAAVGALGGAPLCCAVPVPDRDLSSEAA
jgi:hypothetical protein